MPSNHLILCCPLLLLPSIFPSIRVFSNESLFESGNQSTGASASASVLPMNIQDWFPLEWTGWISLQSKGLSRVCLLQHGWQYKIYSLLSWFWTSPFSMSSSDCYFLPNTRQTALLQISNMEAHLTLGTEQQRTAWMNLPSSFPSCNTLNVFCYFKWCWDFASFDHLFLYHNIANWINGRSIFKLTDKCSPKRLEQIILPSHHFMGNRWGNSGNSVRHYFFGLQNHCRLWLQPWN